MGRRALGCWREGTQTNRQYMRRNNTDYRTKLQAVFLAAIMVISVVGMSVAFAGAAAAQEPGEVDYEPRDNPYQGQTILANISDDNDVNEGDDIDLRLVDEFDNGSADAEITSSTFVEELEVIDVQDVDGLQVEIDTDDLESGDYFLRDTNRSLSETRDNTFEVRIQDLDAEFDDDTVADDGDDAVTELEIDSNRGNYPSNVSADGDLDDRELIYILTEGNDTIADHMTADEIRQNVSLDQDAQGNNVLNVTEDVFTTDVDDVSLSDDFDIDDRSDFRNEFPFAPYAYSADE